MKAYSEDLLDVIGGANQIPEVRLEYLDDNAEWRALDGIISLSINDQGITNEYGVFKLLPRIPELSVSLTNQNEQYTPGYGGLFDGVLTNGRYVRALMGYRIPTGSAQTKSILSTEFSYYRASYNTGTGRYHTSSSPTDWLSLDGFTLQDTNSISFNYTPPGTIYNAVTDTGDNLVINTGDNLVYSNAPWYYGCIESNPIDLYFSKSQDINTITFNSDNTIVYVFYRTGNDLDILADTEYKYAGQSSVGTNNIAITETDDRYIQVVFAWNTAVVDLVNNYISNVSIGYTEFAELFDYGIFEIDVPTITSSGGSSTANISARSFLRRAFESNVTTPAYSNADLATIIRDIAVRAKLPYTDISIPLTGVTVTISDSETFKNIKTSDALNTVMTYCNAIASGNLYLLFKDGLLTLVERPESPTEPDFGISYQNQSTQIGRTISRNQFLTKVKAEKQSFNTAEQSTLYNNNITTSGQVTINYPAGSFTNKYTNVILTADYNSSSSDTKIEVVSNSREQIVIDVTGTTIDIDLIIYGSELTVVDAETSEQFSVDGAVDGRGFERTFTNVFIQSYDDAVTVAEKMIDNFGSRQFNVTIITIGLPFLEINDKIFVADYRTNLQNIMLIDSIRLDYTGSGSQFKTTINCVDSGYTNEYWNWDRHNVINGGLDPGNDDLLWDYFFWDLDIYGDEIDTDTYLINQRF